MSHDNYYVFPQPQVSMPDVIIWMISGDKRIAYYRMPAHLLLFSETEVACGKFCGKTIELQLKVHMQPVIVHRICLGCIKRQG